jgi:hypothetical protein
LLAALRAEIYFAPHSRRGRRSASLCSKGETHMRYHRYAEINSDQWCFTLEMLVDILPEGEREERPGDFYLTAELASCVERQGHVVGPVVHATRLPHGVRGVVCR